MENILETIDKKALGERLHAARVKADFSIEWVASCMGIHPFHLYALEEGLTAITPSGIICLAHLYNCQVHDLVADPLPYIIAEEAFEGYLNEDISEGVLARFLTSIYKQTS